MSRTVRHFNASCPDCGRWRCVCGAADQPQDGDDDSHPLDGVDYGPIPGGLMDGILRELGTVLLPMDAPPPVRTGPPPAPIRERMAKLREEIAEHLGKSSRRG